jgi:hypothetical protein
MALLIRYRYGSYLTGGWNLEGSWRCDEVGLTLLKGTGILCER